MAAKINPPIMGDLQNPLKVIFGHPDQDTWMKTSNEYIWIKDYSINWIELEKLSPLTKLRLTFLKKPPLFSARLTSYTLNFVIPGYVLRHWGNTSNIDLSKFPARITHIEFDDCRGLNAASLSTLPNHLVEVVFKRLVVVRGIQGLTRLALEWVDGMHVVWIIHPPKINHLTSLRVIQFERCNLDQLDWLPDQLETLHLEGCALLRVVENVSKFSLKSLSKVRQITLDKCTWPFIVEFTENARTESLRIWNHTPRLMDDAFENFPKPLKEFALTGANVTDQTVEKLGNGMRSIQLEDCPNVTMNSGRASLFFAGCDFKGFKKETSKTDRFRELLEQTVIGQPQAINAAFQALNVSLSGITPKGRPSGVFLFVGPSGVGKTELAKTVASVGGRQLLRYDMSEYQLDHEVAKFIGPPPGYQSNLAGGKLTNDVTKNPNAIVLFDEVEKAHPNIHKALLGVFDAGRLTDGRGITTDFSQTIIIMTSNLGAMNIAALPWDNVEAAIQKSKEIVLEILKKIIAPEFAGRIDAVVPFRPLEKDVVINIMRSKVKMYEREIKEKHNLQVEVQDSVWDSLLGNLDLTLGVRPVIRQFEQEVNAEIGQAILNEFIRKGESVQVFRENKKIKFRLIRARARL